MNFVFISPNFPKTYYMFCQGLKNNGVNVLAIGDESYDTLDQRLKDSLTEYYKVNSLENYDEVFKAVAYLSYKHGKIDWLESNNEYWLLQDAQLRTDFNISTGLKNDQIDFIKYKSKMKELYAKAGVKTARYHLVNGKIEDGKKFVEQVGYPVVVKPDNGVGAAATYKVSNEEQLEKFYNTLPEVPYIMEEFVDGTIVSFDGVADSNRVPIFETSHYFPVGVMDMVNEKKEAIYHSVREIPEDLKEIGRRVIATFPSNSRFFHCEYFRLNSDKEGLGKKGDIIGLEVNMRSPGGYTPDMMNYANNINVYQIWADMVTKDSSDYSKDRPYYCAYAARRDCFQYAESIEDAVKKLNLKIVMRERMPEAISEAMGNEMVTVITESEEEVYKFYTEVLKKA